MEFAERVRILMKENGLSNKALAEKTGEHNTAISNYLTGKRKPKADFILKLADVFEDADLNWLFRGSGRDILQEEGTKYSVPKTPELIIESIEENLGELKQLLSQK
ncbi:helix-turn-helix transcriptional regulator [Salegentibacter sp. BDJ18]|uniref:helix-turn-helix domain-containing protein n=1 Tax=Salegentibacter sp. BDJ18 TaxID=2816376 RepID=UPI001AAF99EC|nr:helix-turn-helix transcriptional regulator [Salegentibacter sp. BDJ18]MBO2546059.1 helix-turn-helix transcriptional regulator [Salegentibacter sp. BDJ18]